MSASSIAKQVKHLLRKSSDYGVTKMLWAITCLLRKKIQTASEKCVYYTPSMYHHLLIIWFQYADACKQWYIDGMNKRLQG